MIDDGEFGRLPYSKIKKYDKFVLRSSYKKFFKSAEKYKLKWYKTNVLWYNKKKDSFDKGWEIRNGKWKLCYDFGYDFIFDKTGLTKRNLKWKRYFQKRSPFMNHINLEKACSDKWFTWKIFRNIMPITFLINNKTELKKKLKKIQGDMIVIKPRYGSSAKDVLITTKNKLPKIVKKNTILQEFKKCNRNKRLSHFNYNVYDLRVPVCCGKICSPFFRASAPNKLVSNVSFGGKSVFVKKGNLSKKIIRIVRNIDKRFRRYNPRFYAIDFVIDKNKKPWLIEMNSKPAFFFSARFCKEKRRTFFQNILFSAIRRAIK